MNKLACPFRDTKFSGCNSLSGVVSNQVHLRVATQASCSC